MCEAGRAGKAGNVTTTRAWTTPRWRDAALTGVAAVAAVAWTVVGTAGGPIVPLLVLGGLGIAARIIEPPRTFPPVAAVFTGAVVLLASPVLAVWTAVAVAAVGVAREGAGARQQAAVHVLAVVTGAVAARLGDRWFTGQHLVAAGVTPTVGVRTALFVGLVLSGVWILLGLVVSGVHVERDLSPLRELAISAAAVLTAVVWVSAPPLVLLMLLVLAAALAVAGGGTTTRGSVGPPNLHEVATRALERVARTGEPLSVLVVELHGSASREALDAAAERIRTGVDGAGVVCPAGPRRVGAVLTAADGAVARQVAVRIAEEVATAEGPLTCAIGIAAHPDNGDDAATLVTEAELAAAYATLEGPGHAAFASTLPSGFHRPPSTGRRRTDDALAGADLVRAAPVPLASARPATDRLLAGVVAAAAVVVLTTIVLVPGWPAWWLLASLTALVAVAEYTAAPLERQLAVSWAAVPLIATGVLAGQPAASAAVGMGGALAIVVPTVAGALAGGLLRGVWVRQLLFNTATIVLATFSAAGVARLLDPVTPGTGLGDLAVAGLVAGVAFVVVDTILVAVAGALASDGRPVTWWREELRWLVPGQLALALLGGVTAFAAVHLGIGGLLVGVLPAAGLAVAQQRLLRDVGGRIVAMRAASEEAGNAARRLTVVNDRLTGALSRVNEGYIATLETLASVVASRVASPDESARRETYGRRLLEAVDPALLDDEAVRWIFRLHDIGMITAPDELLHKTGPLDDAERDLLREHARVGAELIARAPFLERARPVILHHHERWDGSGYPFGLAGEAIPLPARVLAVVDAYVAMTSPRHHRRALSADEALEELIRGAGTHFDPDVIEAFLHLDRQQAEGEARRLAAVDDPAGGAWG